jgi:hypothetical protein
VRRTGYRLVVAAARDLRLLKEFVVETHRALCGDPGDPGDDRDMLELAPYDGARDRARA